MVSKISYTVTKKVTLKTVKCAVLENWSGGGGEDKPYTIPKPLHPGECFEQYYKWLTIKFHNQVIFKLFFIYT